MFRSKIACKNSYDTNPNSFFDFRFFEANQYLMNISATDILQSIPQRFRVEKAEGFNTIVHIDLSGANAVAYTIEITEGKCLLQEGLHDKPTCTVQSSTEDYVALETGAMNPQMALMSGKVKVSNIAEMLQFTKCFRRFDATKDKSNVDAQSIHFNQRPQLSGPLKGVKILDFTRLLPGPLATMFLAQQGADVIKIEDPDSPDYIRSFEPQVNGASAFYFALNSNKRSLSINYLSEEGKAVIHQLVKDADVLIEQYRPGVMAKFRLDYETLKAINPRLIYVSVTGYGNQSSLAKDAGHDLNYIAHSGLPYISGNTPTLPGFQAADIAGGTYMAMNAITIALYEREKTGKGNFVNVAMTDCVLPLMALPLALQQYKDELVNASNFELAGSIANYNIYECADGKYVALGSLEPKFWNAFCEAVDKQEWKGKILADTNTMEALKQEVDALFKSKSQQEWITFLQHTDCCITPVNDLKEVLNDEYLNEQKLFIENQHPAMGNFKTLRHPLKFESTNFAQNWVAPELGEDTTTILKQTGYNDDEIKILLQKGIIH